MERIIESISWLESNEKLEELILDDVESTSKYLLKHGFEQGIYTIESPGKRAFLVLREENPRWFGLKYDPPYLVKCFKMGYKGIIAEKEDG